MGNTVEKTFIIYLIRRDKKIFVVVVLRNYSVIPSVSSFQVN